MLDGKYYCVEVPRVTMEGIQSQYPHLSEDMVERLFECGELSRKPMGETSLNNGAVKAYFSYRFELHIPKLIADLLDIDKVIHIAPDENGIICRVKFMEVDEMRERTVSFTRDEIDVVYTQLCARKQYFEEDMMFWAEKKDVDEVRRCARAIEKIETVINKILNS